MAALQVYMTGLVPLAVGAEHVELNGIREALSRIGSSVTSLCGHGSLARCDLRPPGKESGAADGDAVAVRGGK